MDKDAIIKKLVEENKLLTEHIKLLEEKIQLLEEYKTKLEERIAQLEKNSNNSSKPPSRDIVKPLKLVRRLGKKRKRGGQHGHRKFSRQPFEPERHLYSLDSFASFCVRKDYRSRLFRGSFSSQGGLGL